MSTQLYNGECLAVMATLPEQSVDAVVCDPPYGFTACKWDAIIPFAPMWSAMERLVKPRGAIVLTCNQPFTSALVMSKPDWYRHCWVWDKVRPSGFQCSKHRPMMRHEDVMVFSKEPPNYRPLCVRKEMPIVSLSGYRKRVHSESNPLAHQDGKKRLMLAGFPQSILRYAKPGGQGCFRAGLRGHPTQKSLELMEYLVRTYAREGQTVLDFTMGSGTTGEACVNTNRNFIGIELDPHWFSVATQRVQHAETRRICATQTLGLGFEDDYMEVEEAVKILEEIDPPMAAAWLASDGTEEDDATIDEVFGA